LTIAHLTGDSVSLARAERTLARYGPRIGAAARVVPMMLCALSAWHAGHSQVVIAGDPASPDAHALAREAARHYLPFSIQIPLRGDVPGDLSRVLPFVSGMSANNGAAAYVCHDFACRQPVSTPEALRGELQSGMQNRK
jgi:uncharacterized protein